MLRDLSSSGVAFHRFGHHADPCSRPLRGDDVVHSTRSRTPERARPTMRRLNCARLSLGREPEIPEVSPGEGFARNDSVRRHAAENRTPRPSRERHGEDLEVTHRRAGVRSQHGPSIIANAKSFSTTRAARSLHAGEGMADGAYLAARAGDGLHGSSTSPREWLPEVHPCGSTWAFSLTR